MLLAVLHWSKDSFFGKGLSPLQAFNSQYMKSLRLGMLNNEKPTPVLYAITGKVME